MRGSRGSTLVEFALTWPLLLLVVMGGLQLAIWFSDQHAAHAAALAGARAGARVGQGPAAGQAVALAILRTSLLGPGAGAWCAGDPAPPPPVWACGRDLGGAVEVQVGGTAAALLPFLPAAVLDVRGDAVLAREQFT